MKKVIAIRTCAIGDFVFNLPALLSLQKRYPHARFTLVGNPSALDIAQAFIAVDEIYSMELQPWSRLFYEPIPELEFDTAIVWMKDPVVSDNLRGSGIPTVMRADAFPSYGHAADHLLRTLGLPRPELPDMWKPGGSDVIVNAGSGSAKKNWPYFCELMAPLDGSRTMPQDLSLLELMREISRCRLFVGNDSGITHLASYIGCPTIALFGPTDPRTWGPIGRRARVLWKSRLEDITVDEVLLTVHGTRT